MHARIAVATLIALLATLSSTASAQAPPAPKAAAKVPTWNIGAKAGILLPGEVYVEIADNTFDTDQGFVGELTLDAAVAPNFMMGAFVLIATTEASDSGEDATITDLGATLKGRFGTLGQFEVRPGIALAYQTIEVGDLDDIDGLNVAAIFEIAYFMDRATALLAELSFISQPTGGNEDTEVTFAPILFLAFGAAYAGF